jgi:hypothetical protein
MKVIALILAACVSSIACATTVTLDENGVMVIDGRKTFILSVSIPPLPGAKTPDGKDGLAQLAEDGLTATRVRGTTGPQDLSEAGIRSIGAWLDAAAANHLYCWVTLGQLPSTKSKLPDHDRLLKLATELYKDHPALCAWKGFDEAAWVKMPADALVPIYRQIKQLDPNHPVIIIQAPMKSALPLEPYADAGDIFGVDIYPVTFPPGNHSDLPNKEISLVADWTKIIRESSRGKPIWMTLQIAWAGTATPGKTLRFPSFPQQRYMTYAAIINGARGVNFQGGERPLSLNERDAKLGWNWTYWNKVMRPLFEELRATSPLHKALIAADSKLPVKVSDASVEFCVREVGDDIFILAAKRQGESVKVKWSGLPLGESTGDVLYEEPRKVTVKEGKFEDWFAPFDVHVYRLRRR